MSTRNRVGSLLTRIRLCSSRFASLRVLALWYVALGVVGRLVLWCAFGRDAEISVADLGWIIPSGLIADAIEVLYLLVPWATFLWLVPRRWYDKPTMRVVMFVGVYLWIFALTAIGAIEYYFFEEFDSRFNLVSVDYLMFPTEVVGNVWNGYPVVPILLLVGTSTAIIVFLIRRGLVTGRESPVGFGGRSVYFSCYVSIVVIAALSFSTNSLELSRNRVANEIAANGPSSFFRAMRTSEIDYHTYYASQPREQNLRLLSEQLSHGRGRFTRLAEGRLDRQFDARPGGLGRLHVVVVVSESFGAEFSALYGSRRNWTPQFDKFAAKSLWFRNMYASGTRTVRGLEAIAASFPPIPSVSIVRRPHNERIATWGKVMRDAGYHTSFLYGGYGYFDNLNAFFANNGFDVRDRNQIPKPVRFENVWGVSDEDLYDMALAYFDEQARSGAPFFSIVMNTSNHRPYTFRSGVSGVLPVGGGRESGVRYADHALGYFLRAAAERPWFDDTIFVIVADHGSRVFGRQDIPLKSYEIPMLIYSPRHISPRRIDSLTTQIDIAPTVLGLLGIPYTAPFFGQDVLETPTSPRVAFFSHNHDVAILKDDELAILGLQKTIKDVHYDRASDTYRDVPLHLDLDALAIAYYQTAFELFQAHAYE